jgi:hypothetical protein
MHFVKAQTNQRRALILRAAAWAGDLLNGHCLFSVCHSSLVIRVQSPESSGNATQPSIPYLLFHSSSYLFTLDSRFQTLATILRYVGLELSHRLRGAPLHRPLSSNDEPQQGAGWSSI